MQTKVMQNVTLVNRPKFHVLSNDAFAFTASIICIIYKKIDKIIQLCLYSSCIYFQHIGLNVRGKLHSSLFKRA